MRRPPTLILTHAHEDIGVPPARAALRPWSCATRLQAARGGHPPGPGARARPDNSVTQCARGVPCPRGSGQGTRLFASPSRCAIPSFAAPERRTIAGSSPVPSSRSPAPDRSDISCPRPSAPNPTVSRASISRSQPFGTSPGRRTSCRSTTHPPGGRTPPDEPPSPMTRTEPRPPGISRGDFGALVTGPGTILRTASYVGTAPDDPDVRVIGEAPRSGPVRLSPRSGLF